MNQDERVEYVREQRKRLQDITNGDVDALIAAYDELAQSSLDYCNTCGWRTYEPGVGCVRCEYWRIREERSEQAEQHSDELTIAHMMGAANCNDRIREAVREAKREAYREIAEALRNDASTIREGHPRKASGVMRAATLTEGFFPQGVGGFTPESEGEDDGRNR
jgi:predicted  nucleic acid-binding Zn-ribbon protein